MSTSSLPEKESYRPGYVSHRLWSRSSSWASEDQIRFVWNTLAARTDLRFGTYAEWRKRVIATCGVGDGAIVVVECTQNPRDVTWVDVATTGPFPFRHTLDAMLATIALKGYSTMRAVAVPKVARFLRHWGWTECRATPSANDWFEISLRAFIHE